jgi:D-alanine-D-alanine ligase-like ATP-grasp enzyme
MDDELRILIDDINQILEDSFQRINEIRVNKLEKLENTLQRIMLTNREIIDELIDVYDFEQSYHDQHHATSEAV